jgi:cytochrome b subunit of formate dehydrogenase
MTVATLERTASSAEAAPVSTATYVLRFDRKTRSLHLATMISFLVLAATGLPLLFSEAAWAPWLAAVFGGFRGAGLVHRVFGAVLLVTVVYHVGDVFWRALVRRERGLLWGPDSMVPQPRDFLDFFAQVKWFLGRGPQPRFERFTYWEKFDYWAVLWGTALMGAAGLVLWFPVAASRLLPGWLFNVALFVHGAEAVLAIGFIFVVHFFNGHLRPEKFPMDMVIFTGRLPAAEMRHERAAQYDRLAAAGQLDALTVEAPPPAALSRGRWIGGIGLVTGIALIALILYAVWRSPVF